MNYRQAREYLKEAGKKRGMVLGLDTMRDLMKLLGNPQDKLRFLHIAGTNGKGSAASWLERTLSCAGYRTGKYTSPAVFDFREQYQINGVWISEEEAAEAMTQIADAVSRMEAEGLARPTVFEQETALAFLWFARRGCELVVLETGLGGDEDATNIITTTVCSILTSISLEHSRILGGSLREIAGHKAGILKPGVPVVSHDQEKEAMDVIRDRCRQLGCPLSVSKPDQVVREAEDRTGVTVSYREFRQLHTKQTAVWQNENMAVALETIRVLRRLGCRIDDRAVADGWEQMVWHGRFEVIEGRPGMILDGAHNPAGAAALRRSLEHSFPDQKKVFVMGVLADKDYRSMIRILLREEQTTVFTVASDSPRALPAGKLAGAVREECPRIKAEAADSVAWALELAERAAGEDGWIVVCGSLSFMKEAARARRLWG